jgi:branched-chain amino acid transport system substrate-binding protein
VSTRTGRRRAARIGATALTLAALLAGCGDDGAAGSSGGPGGDGSGDGSTAEGDSLKVGVIVNASGPTSTGEESAPPVLEAWADAVNARGGVAGHPVEVVVEDTQGDASKATAFVERMAGDEAFVAVVLFDAGTEGAVAEAITDAGLPVVGGMGYAPTAWTTLANWLPLTTSFPSVINMGMVLADELGATKTVFPVCSENPSCAAAEPLAEAASTALGMDFAGTLPVSVAAPDYTAECLQFEDSGVDYVMLGVTTAAALRMVADCETQGYQGDYGIFDGSVWPEVMIENDPGEPIAVALSAFPWYTDDEPVAAYREAMEGQGVPEENWGSPHGTAAYATMELFRVALEGAAADGAAGDARPTRADVVEAYGTIADEDLGGLLPQPVSFTPGEAQAPVTCYWLATFEDGAFHGGGLDDVTCDPPELAAAAPAAG